MNRQIYDWNIGWSDRFTADRPVPENTYLFDLYNGDMIFVAAIRPAALPDIPRQFMSVQRAGRLSDDQLLRLRKKAGYVSYNCALALGDIVFFTNEAELREFLQQP